MVQWVDSAKSAQLDAGMERVRMRFFRSLAERKKRFSDLLGALHVSERRAETADILKQEAHSLHGLSGIVGCSDISAGAAALEQRIESQLSALGQDDVAEVAALVAGLLETMGQYLDAG